MGNGEELIQCERCGKWLKYYDLYYGIEDHNYCSVCGEEDEEDFRQDQIDIQLDKAKQVRQELEDEQTNAGA